MPPLFDHLDFVENIPTLSPLGLITDIDGTISRPAPTPSEAQVSPICRNYLALLSKHLKLVAAISGRPAFKVREMVGLEDIIYIGNHGLERWTNGKAILHKGMVQYPALIEATLQDLKSIHSIEGIILENKGPTASIHYRLCRDRDSARTQIMSALANSPNAKDLLVRQGRMTVELVPPVEVNKGSAALELIKEYQLRAAIYLGDDLTDLDAFRAIHEARTPDFDGICLAVIDKETVPEVEEGADFTLNGVNEVERFLEWLARAVQG